MLIQHFNTLFRILSHLYFPNFLFDYFSCLVLLIQHFKTFFHSSVIMANTKKVRLITQCSESDLIGYSSSEDSYIWINFLICFIGYLFLGSSDRKREMKRRAKQRKAKQRAKQDLCRQKTTKQNSNKKTLIQTQR